MSEFSRVRGNEGYEVCEDAAAGRFGTGPYEETEGERVHEDRGPYGKKD